MQAARARGASAPQFQYNGRPNECQRYCQAFAVNSWQHLHISHRRPAHSLRGSLDREVLQVADWTIALGGSGRIDCADDRFLLLLFEKPPVCAPHSVDSPAVLFSKDTLSRPIAGSRDK